MKESTPRIDSICIGEQREILHEGKPLFTGIYKFPTANIVEVQWESLAGDHQVDRRFHGGRDKAIYVYPNAQYAHWEKELKRGPLGASFFGENLSISGLSDETVYIGNRYQLGSALVVVSQPRIPCFKLGIRTGDETFPAKFLSAGWLGFYLRVEEVGFVQEGQSFKLLQKDPNCISVRDLWQMTFTNKTNPEMAARALAVLPLLDQGWKKRLHSIASRA